MIQVDVLKEVVWRWVVPALVLVVGLSEALANNTGASRLFEIGVAFALTVPLTFRSQTPRANS